MAFFDLGLSDVLGGALSFIGGERQNAAQRAVAARQMQFQERMSSTAYQRAVKDMRAAGINPMLAYSKGGATTPGGAGLPMGDPIGKGVSTALQSRRLRQEMSLMESQRWKNLGDAQLSAEKSTTEGAVQANLHEVNKVLKEQVHSARAAGAAAKIEYDIDTSWFGKLMRHLGRLNPLASSARSAAGAKYYFGK